MAARRAEAPNRRRYIQGLRAIAVVAVVLFHAKLPIAGGFAGVDVFFVVSGYVITAMLRREWVQDGDIRLGRFYVRRFIRLAPALALTSFTTVVVWALLFSPEGSRQAAGTAAAATLFVANWNIALTTGGYFGLAADANPLLNTWSLSVEEQFYLFFPTLLWVSWKLSRTWKRLPHFPQFVVGFVGVSSLAAVFLLADWGGPLVQYFMLGFYGPVGRVWEFAIGALLAFHGCGNLGKLEKLSASLSIGGALLLLVAFFCMDDSVPYPGLWTLAPTLGTALLLISAGQVGNPVGALLSSEPLVRIGDWSYSIYLWHWPFIAIVGLLWPGEGSLALVAAAVSIAPALASYYWLESPIRHIGTSRPGVPLSAVLLVGSSLLAVIALMWMPNSYWFPGKLLGNAHTPYKGEIDWRDYDYREGGFEVCDSPVLRRMAEDGADHEPRCQQAKTGSSIDLALIGDSHAEHLFIGLSEAMPDQNVMYFTTNAFPTLDHPEYAAAVDYVNSNPAIRRVIVTAFWSGRPFDKNGLEGVLRSLVAHGKEVIMTDDLPSFPLSGPSPCKYYNSSLCVIGADDFWAEYRTYGDQLEAIVKSLPGVALFKTASYLCDEETCSMTRGDEILYADSSHLNVLGSRFVGRRMVDEHRSQLVDSTARVQ